MLTSVSRVRDESVPAAAERVSVTLDATELAQLTRYLGGAVSDERIHPVERGWMRALYARLASGACEAEPTPRAPAYDPLEDVRLRAHLRLLLRSAEHCEEHLRSSGDASTRAYADDLREARVFLARALAAGRGVGAVLGRDAA